MLHQMRLTIAYSKKKFLNNVVQQQQSYYYNDIYVVSFCSLPGFIGLYFGYLAVVIIGGWIYDMLKKKQSKYENCKKLFLNN